MRRTRVLPLLATLAVVLAAQPAQAAALPGAPACPMTPANSFWHADGSALPIHAQSPGWLNSIGIDAALKADFGAGMWDGGPIGIPYTTVAGSQPRVPVHFDYADESDPGPYPIPPDAPVEGGGDRHVLVVDRDRCELWETWASARQPDNSWTAGSGAHFSLTSNAMRPAGWTSSDAAGLPILPGLVRYDEVASGVIDHAIRFTAPRTAPAYVWPASHQAATGSSADPPMGTWVRLKASVDISGYSPVNQVILRALKQHGMVLADNGSSWYMSGAPDERWDNDDLRRLAGIKGSNFDVVEASSLKVADGSYQAGGSPPPPPPPATNLVGNPGFETSTSGWSAAGATLARVAGGHSGSWSARLTRTKSTGAVTLDDAPNWVTAAQARAYAAGGWVKGPAGRTAVLRIRQLRGSMVMRTTSASITLTGGWQQVSTTTVPPAAGDSLDLQIIGLSFSANQQLFVDDLSLV